MTRHTQAVDTLTAELEQESIQDDQLQTMDSFVATASHALKAAGTKDGRKREFLRGLGVGAEMGRGKTGKYVDWYIFAPSNLSVRLQSQCSGRYLHGEQVARP